MYHNIFKKNNTQMKDGIAVTLIHKQNKINGFFKHHL